MITMDRSIKVLKNLIFGSSLISVSRELEKVLPKKFDCVASRIAVREAMQAKALISPRGRVSKFVAKLKADLVLLSNLPESVNPAVRRSKMKQKTFFILNFILILLLCLYFLLWKHDWYLYKLASWPLLFSASQGTVRFLTLQSSLSWFFPRDWFCPGWRSVGSPGLRELCTRYYGQFSMQCRDIFLNSTWRSDSRDRESSCSCVLSTGDSGCTI